MDLKQIFQDGVIAVITAIVTFLPTKRVYQANSKDIETKVTKSIFTTYDDVINSMHKQITEYINRMDNLEKSFHTRESEYIKRIDELEKTVNRLVEENNSLREDLAEFEKKYGKQSKTHKMIEDGNKQ